MSKIQQLIAKQGAKNFNEFYTLYEEADKLLTPFLDYILEAKTIYCPADGEESNIVKWLRDNCDATILYNKDKDFNSEEIREEMLRADIIITNPPFAMKQFRPFLTWLVENNKNFIIWGPMYSKSMVKIMFNSCYMYDYQRSNMHPYMYKDRTIKYAMSRLYSSYPIKANFKPNRDYDLSYLPGTALCYYDHDEYECLGKAKQRDPKDFIRYILVERTDAN